MSYTPKNPRFESTVLTDQTTSSVTAPASGSYKYVNRNGLLYVVDSSGVETLVGASSGTKNYLSKWFDFEKDPTTGVVTTLTATGNRTSNTTVWGSSASSLLSYETSAPLRSPGSAKLTLTGASAAQFIETPMFTLDAADLGKPICIKYDAYASSSGHASGDIDMVVIRYNSSGTYQETISPALSNVGPGYFTFNSFFVSGSTATDQYSIRWRSQNASARILYVDSLTVGPQSIAMGPALTNWQSYTPTFTGLGTVGTTSVFYRRVGDSIEVVGETTAGTVAAATVSISLPTGLNLDTTKMSGNLSNLFGTAYRGGGTSNNIASTAYGAWAVVDNQSNSTTAVYIASQTNAIYNLTNGSAILSNGDYVGFRFTAPISQWSSSNFQTADRAVEEYAYNTSGNNTTSDTSSFGYGPSGNVIGSITAALSRRVRFQTPIQATDYLVVEIKDATVNKWFPVIGGNISVGAASCQSISVQNGVEYGVGVLSVVNSTDVDVRFGQYSAATGATYGATGQAWSTGAGTAYFRVRKVSGGSTVGYPVSSQNVVGRIDGVAQAAGYIGEVVTGTTTTGSLTTGTAKNAANITLQPGVWQIVASIYYSLGASTTCSGSRSSISTTTNTTDLANMNCGVNTSAGNDFANIVTRLVNISSATTYYAVANLTFATSTADIGSNSYIKAIRIA